MNFFLIFHHNLAFSSIPTHHYPYLISCVYSSILDLAEAGIPLGLEYTAQTLEIIEDLCPDYISRLKSLLSNKKAELIGSGYSQIIFPLIPSEVNKWNLNLGTTTYEKLIGHRPLIAYPNELCYSDSLPEFLRHEGFEAFLFDWSNASKDNDWPIRWRYIPVVHARSGLKILWCDAIFSQKFQRVIWGDIDYQDWLSFIRIHEGFAHENFGEIPCLCLYASDAEVFDYQPGSLETYTANKGHFDRIKTLIMQLAEGGRSNIILPTDVLRIFSVDKLPKIARIATPSYPVRTKKQDKYNVTRWAVTGRAASRMNTQCFRLYNLILEKQRIDPTNCEIDDLKKNLVFLWGSDFRTHTTDEKIEIFRHKMGSALEKLSPNLFKNNVKNEHNFKDNWLSSDNGSFETAIQGRRFIVKGPGSHLVLLKNKGLAIEHLAFGNSSKYVPVIGTINHGEFKDISLGSDLFSAHVILITHDGHQFTDISQMVDELIIFQDSETYWLRNKTPMNLPGLSIIKSIGLGKERAYLKLVYDLYAKDLRPATLRLGIFTIHPNAFKKDEMYFQTHLGGAEPEKFFLSGSRVFQDQPVNHIVSCRHCLGNTEGIMRIGDQESFLEIKTKPWELYSVPLLHYEEIQDAFERPSYFCRIYYSICERDDVANVFWKGHMRISFEVRYEIITK